MLSVLIFALILSGYAAVANAWDRDCKYYRLICPQGDVQIGAEVTITAKTNDSNVDYVKFYIDSPIGSDPDPLKVSPLQWTWDGTKKVYYATLTLTVDEIGDWKIKAYFKGGGDSWWWCDDVCVVRCCRFHVVPEIPMLGTIGASSSLLLGFAYKLKRKTKK